MDFRITGLSPEPFRPLFVLGDEDLKACDAVRMTVDECPGFPDRISMRDVPVGEAVILVNHVSQPAATPYRASHAIFVWEEAGERYDRINEVPEVMRRRLLSLRAFDEGGMMLDADVVEGREVEMLIRRMFADEAVATIHVHNAKRGCYAGLVERVGGDATS